jgi:hypothetical protein
MAAEHEPRWWTLRRAQSAKPSTYRCPLCGKLLHAMSEHVLIAPEGDAERRRHAHTACVEAARRAGSLPSRDEWRATQPRTRGVVQRLIDAIRA